ncbi:MAG TPA: GNAT family N-acetyltransferase [Waddliaceae bacterium]
MSNEGEEGKEVSIPGLEFRYTELIDGKYLKQWLLEREVQRWFPMHDEAEIDDAVGRWISFSRYKCSLTALLKGEPCGIATLYLQPYKKLAHQCEFGIIVGGENRGKGIGTKLIQNLSHLAKERFKIELLHLQVYAGNPAIKLYSRMGFVEFGRQTHWIKEEGNKYVARMFMEKFL